MAKFIIPIDCNISQNFGHEINGFLYDCDNNIYLMGNHRLALWGWLQTPNIFSSGCDLIHIDKHFDCAEWWDHQDIDSVISKIRSLANIKNYESLMCRDGNGKQYNPIIWDNFLSLAIKANVFKKYYFVVKQDFDDRGLFNRSWLGFDEKKFKLWKRVALIKWVFLKKRILALLGFKPNKVVIDIDADYFESDADSEIGKLSKIINSNRDLIVGITIALTNGDDYKDIFNRINLELNNDFTYQST